MTNWVTIKIPEETRDKAKEDSRTYEQIMQDGLDNPVPVEERSNPYLPEDYAEEIMDKLKQVEGGQANTVSEAVELAENHGQDHKRILNRIDDLETELQTLREAMQR